MTTKASPQEKTHLLDIRRWSPTIKTQRILALVLLIAQGGITVTGSIVRVTGSGLGCDTWPNCHPGSLVPVSGAAPALQQALEFGNRLLTFVLIAFAAAITIALYSAQRRQELKVYAWLSVAGIVLQAVIGGITVLVDLRWWAVALHFLPSMVLVWIAAMLFSRLKQPDEAEMTKVMPDYTRNMFLVAAAALAIVLITGTLVTASGPHSGDENLGLDTRLQLDTVMLTYVHAGAMYVYLGLTIVAAVMVFRQKNVPQAAKNIVITLLVIIVVQWAVGLIQYYLGVPRWTVPVHIGLSSVVTAFTALLYAQAVQRLGNPGITGSAKGDLKHRELQDA